MPSPALAVQVARLTRAALDETAGEGYHRSTNHEMKRAPGSATEHVMQTPRARHCIRESLELIRSYGEPGKAVFRFCWRTWSSILQATPRRRWDLVKLPPSAVFRRVYREDDKAHEDWSSIVATRPVNHGVASESLNAKGAVQREWLVAVLKPSSTFSVDSLVHAPGEDGRLEEGVRTRYFEVLDVVTSRNRPKTMPTVHVGEEDVMATAAVAFHVQMLDRFDPEEGGSAPDAAWRLVHKDMEAQWVVPSKLAPFDDMAYRMTHWQQVTESAAIDGCLLLERPCRARAMIPIMDANCPAATVYAVLTHKGWKPVQHMVKHPNDASEFGGRDGVKLKWYYKCLLDVEGSLRLAGGGFRSTEPIGCFQALLRKIAIAPGQPATVYRDALQDHRRTKGEDALPLDDDVWDDDGDVAPPLPPPAADEDAVILGPAEEDRKPKPARKPTGQPLGPPTGGAAGSGGGASGSGGVCGPVGVGGAPPVVGEPGEDDVVLGPPAPATPAPAPGESDEDSEDAVALGPAEEAAPEPVEAKRKEPRDYIVGPTGCKLVFKNYLPPGAAKPYLNWLLKCNHHGSSCCKKKGAAAAFTATHGDIEPIALLHAWHEIPWPRPGGKRTHAQEEPTPDAVDAMVAMYAEEFADIHAEAMRRL